MAWYELVETAGKFAVFDTDAAGGGFVNVEIIDQVTGQTMTQEISQWGADFDSCRGGCVAPLRDPDVIAELPAGVDVPAGLAAIAGPVTGVGGELKSLAIDSDVAPSVFDWVPLDVAPWTNA